MHFKSPMNLKFRQDNGGDGEGGDEELGAKKGKELAGHGKQVHGLAVSREGVCTRSDLQGTNTWDSPL